MFEKLTGWSATAQSRCSHNRRRHAKVSTKNGTYGSKIHISKMEKTHIFCVFGVDVSAEPEQQVHNALIVVDGTLKINFWLLEKQRCHQLRHTWCSGVSPSSLCELGLTPSINMRSTEFLDFKILMVQARSQNNVKTITIYWWSEVTQSKR